MTGKDVIKLLLCTYGFDRDIDIQITKGKMPSYSIVARNERNDCLKITDANGLADAMFLVIDTLAEPKDKYINTPLSEILDDEKRTKVVPQPKQEDDEPNDCGTYE